MSNTPQKPIIRRVLSRSGAPVPVPAAAPPVLAEPAAPKPAKPALRPNASAPGSTIPVGAPEIIAAEKRAHASAEMAAMRDPDGQGESYPVRDPMAADWTVTRDIATPFDALRPDPAQSSLVPADLAQAVRADLSAMRAGLGRKVSSKQADRAASITMGIVQDIALRADAAAAAAIPLASDAQVSSVWADVLDVLAGDGLAPVIYCARSGRKLSDIDPMPWRDHLQAIHMLGETRAADGALTRLVAAMTATMAHTVAPPLLIHSDDNSALLRELMPVDYVMSALGRVMPALPQKGRAAQSTALAQRAQLLGRLRADAVNLPRPALEYLAECLTMYLAHVSPSRVPLSQNALAYYTVHGWQFALSDPAHVSHLCNRLILTLWTLIQSRRLKPSKLLTLADMRGLSIHWGGDPAYQNQRKQRAMIRQGIALGGRADLMGADPITGRGAVRLDEGAIFGLGDTSAFDLADLLDMQSALRMTGRKVQIGVHSPDDKAKLDQRRTAIENLARAMVQEDDASQDVSDLDMSLDLSSIAASGLLDDAFSPDLSSAENILEAGLLGDDDDIFAMLYDEPDDDETALSDADLDALDEQPDDDDTDSELLAALGLGDAATKMLKRPAMSSNAVADIQAAALEKAILTAKPLSGLKLRPR